MATATSDIPQAKMELAGATGGQPAAHPLETVISHRKLVATTFPLSVTAAMTDASAVTDVDNQEMFHCAASQGIEMKVLALIKDGRYSRDLIDRFGRTPLHWAAEQGHRPVVYQLLKAGANVDPCSQREATPLMLAASRGHTEVVRVLLRYRAGESDRLPLNDHPRGIEHCRSTALHCAAAGGNVTVVRRLLNAGFDRGQHDEEGLTPAEVSARQWHSTSADVTRLLLPTHDMGGRLVHDHVNMLAPDVVTVSGLARDGACLDWQDGTGDTPLHRALRFHHIRIASVLLKAGANPNLRDHRGASPLHLAASTGCWEIVPALLQSGADVELLSISGHCPLQLAVVTKSTDIVSSLLDAGASTEHRDAIYGQTPLSWACQYCLTGIVLALVRAGADVDSRSWAGLTPLHWACRFIDAPNVRILLNAGANPSAVDQAAAKDAVVNSSSTSDAIVSRPTAIDVIGLGYPLNREEESSNALETLADGRLDGVSVQRIEQALHFAKQKKQERSWRRRGWLVILANRWMTMGVPGVRDDRSAAGCCGCYSPCHQAVIQLRHVDTGIQPPPCVHRSGAAGYRIDANTNSGSSDSQHPQEQLSSAPDGLGQRLRNVVRSVGVVTRAASRRQGQTPGNSGARENVVNSLSKLVDDLQGLAAAEVGVFRRVVVFI